MTEEERRDSEIHPPSSTSHPSLLNSNCARVQCWSPWPASLWQALPSAPPQVWALLTLACADFFPIHMAQQRGTEGTEETSSLSSSLFQVLGHWTFWEFNINALVSVLAKKLSATIGKKWKTYQTQVLILGTVWKPEKQVDQPLIPENEPAIFPRYFWSMEGYKTWGLLTTYDSEAASLLFSQETWDPAVPHSCLPHSWEAALTIWGSLLARKWQPAGQCHQANGWTSWPGCMRFWVKSVNQTTTAAGGWMKAVLELYHIKN